MEKLMSFFQPAEKRKAAKFEEQVEERSETPPPDDRRKWSISRSGRMKQANKKRHNVSIDLYGETCTPVEKPTSVEYHVNSPVTKPQGSASKPDVEQRRPTPSEPKSPEEEIESAFEILDKVEVDKAS